MILIIDDDAAVRSSLTFLLKRAGYEPEAVPDPQEALAIVRETAPRLILMDMNFTLTTSGEEGIQLLRQVKIFQPHVPVILMTAWGSISLAVEGMRAGAFDFVTKPWNNLVLLKSIRTALELGERKREEDSPLNRSVADKQYHFDHIIGQSALSQSLVESEMVGHKQGAFTDAYMDRVGRFELADKGTIFLDEIGELELACQVKLLRVLQDQTFEPLGDSRPRKVDVRVVSATNRDLHRMVAEHTFREDLFYRINLITVHLPALRERREDIPLLVRYFAERQAEANGVPTVEFSSEALTFLQKLLYPGNIRELKNLVERTLLVSGKRRLEAADFERQYTHTESSDVPQQNLSGLTLDELEKQTILQALKNYGGNLSHVASSMGISRAALYRRLEKHGISIDK